MAKFLTKEQVLSAKDIEEVTVDVPEWGGKVKVKALRGIERDRLENFVQGRRSNGTINIEGVKVLLISMSMVDDKGERMFTEKDTIALNAKSGRALDRVFTAAQKLSGLSDEDVEEMAGN